MRITRQPLASRLFGRSAASLATEPSALLPEDADSELRKWYFAVNGPGLRKQFRLIQVAVTSAWMNTTLQPHCIYHGENCRELEWLKRNGVVVIPHTPSLEPELAAAYGERYAEFRGHWLRIDLPLLETSARQVLYTDIDVMFLRDPRRFRFTPSFLAACEEREIGQRSYFNSGVLVMNLPAIREVYTEFLDQVRARLANDFTYPPHDQKSLNQFFLPRIDWLSPDFNWKPYWGRNHDAVIVHFHGPKPVHAGHIRAGKGATLKDTLVSLYTRKPAAFDDHVAKFEHLLAAARVRDRELRRAERVAALLNARRSGYRPRQFRKKR